MKLCIAYYSPGENTQKLAFSVAGKLPHLSPVLVDLEYESLPTDCDHYLIGFGVRRNACPMQVLESLALLPPSRVAFFVTAALGKNDAYEALLTRQIQAFLPEHTALLGLHQCAGALSQEGRAYFEDQLRTLNQPELYEKVVRECYGHPDENDIQSLIAFCRAWLEEENT